MPEVTMARGGHRCAAADDGIELASHLTAEEMLALADAFGGTRLYVPSTMSCGHRIAEAIGVTAGARLSAIFGANTVRVPIMREARAQHYRKSGRSNAWIAVRLGMTETGVEKLFKRLKNGTG